MEEQRQEAVVGSQENEVTYQDGATPLFLAIEETDWRHALDLAEEHPDQVRTWVRSTGTENTTFAWSMWRRLPIHEACRRQAPAWLVSSLLSTFPESAYHTSEFGELPLHLAVESGAAPEVVNLILVANWSAIVTHDNSGRIPTDILDREELLLLDDHRIVHESLLRCHKSYAAMEKSKQNEQAAIKRKFMAHMTTVQRQHEERLKTEQEKHDQIRLEVTTLQAEIDGMKDNEKAKDLAIEESKKEIDSWKQRVQSLSSEIDVVEEELARERQNIVFLTQELDDQHQEIISRDDMIDCLANDLRTICVMHDETLMDTVRDAEQTMKAMVNSQISLQNQLARQANGIKSLLHARGIDLGHSPTKAIQEEKDPNQEMPIGTHEVADALVAAAMTALKSNLSSLDTASTFEN